MKIEDKIPSTTVENPEALNSEADERVFEDDPDREPNHPGQTLGGYIDYYDLTNKEVAEILDVSRDTISKIVNGHRTKITTDMAIRLSKLFQETKSQFWLNLSQRRMLWEERQTNKSEYNRIEETVEDLNISGKGHGEMA